MPDGGLDRGATLCFNLAWLPAPACLRLRQVSARRPSHKSEAVNFARDLTAPRLLRCKTAGTTEPLSNGGWSGRGILRNAPPAWSGQLPYGGFLTPHFLLKSVALVFAGINPAKRQFFRFGYEPGHETHLRAVARTFGSDRMQEGTSHETTLSSAHQSPVAVSGAMKKPRAFLCHSNSSVNLV